MCFQSGYLWPQWRWAVCYSCCCLGFVGVSVVLTRAAATSAAGAARTRAAARDTVSTTAYRNAEFLCTFFLESRTESCLSFAVYEAGKGIKTGTSTPQTPAYPPYFVTGVPAMVPIAPPSLVDKVSTVPPSDGTLLTAGKHLFFIRKRFPSKCFPKDYVKNIEAAIIYHFDNCTRKCRFSWNIEREILSPSFLFK